MYFKVFFNLNCKSFCWYQNFCTSGKGEENARWVDLILNMCSVLRTFLNPFYFATWRMGDHFVLLVDRLLTESTLEAAIESSNHLQRTMSSVSKENTTEFSPHGMDLDFRSSPSKSVQCRICHDEDEDTNMEVPCSCCGSLKVSDDNLILELLLFGNFNVGHQESK